MNISVYERWLPVAGYNERILVSNRGRLASTNYMRTGRWSLLRLSGCGKGYLKITLCQDANEKTILVHRLVATAWIGPIPQGLEINHKNGRKQDNRVCNLEIVTSAENKRHAREAGLSNNQGEGHGMARLGEEDVLEIRKLRKDGWLLRELADRFKITNQCASLICNRKLWTHI